MTVLQSIARWVFVSLVCATTCSLHAQQPRLGKEDSIRVALLLLDATKAKALNETDKARETLEKVLEIHPCIATAHYELAQLYRQQQHTEQALYHAQQAVECDPQNKWFADTYLKLARTLGSTEDVLRALRLLQNASPNPLPYIIEEAHTLWKYGHHKEAIKLLERAIKQYPEEVKLQTTLVDYYLEAHKAKKAEKLLRTLQNRHPNLPAVHYGLARLYYQRDELERAATELKLLLHLGRDEHLRDAIDMLRDIYLNRWKDDSAYAAILHDAIVNGQGEDYPYYHMFDQLLRRWRDAGERFDARARALLREIAEHLAIHVTDNSAALNIAARIFDLSGDCQMAAQLYQLVLDQRPSDHHTWKLYLQLLETHRQWKALYNAAAQASEIYPFAGDYAYKKALAAHQLGALDQARVHIRSARLYTERSADVEEYAPIAILGAAIYTAVGEYDVAKKWLRHLENKLSSSKLTSAKAHHYHLQMGWMHALVEKLASSGASLPIPEEEWPPHSDYIRALLHADQHPLESIQAWQRLLKNQPSVYFPVWWVYQWIADAYEKAGNTDDALQYRYKAETLQKQRIEIKNNGTSRGN